MSTRDGTPPGGDADASSAWLGAIVARDGDGCVWCSRGFDDEVQPTREHVIPRAVGGPSWIENEVAACRRCNAERGQSLPVDWLAEVTARGRRPRTAVIESALIHLDRRLGARGGTRRVRGRVATELAKLDRA